jgi:serine/threonine-protein kinase HipA
MLQWLLFNYLIGNSDAHAKNLSFLVDAKGMRIAPLYDLVCGSLYGYNDMAQSVGGETNFAVIGQSDWTQLATDCGISSDLVQRLTKQLLKHVQTKLNSVDLACGKNPQNTAIIKKINLSLKRD